MIAKYLNNEERRVFRLHTAYSVLEGILYGFFLLNEFIFLKSLDGSNYHLGILFQFSAVVLLLSVALNEIMKRFKRKHALIVIAFITRLPLIAVIFFPADMNAPGVDKELYHLIFLFIFLCYYLSTPYVFPVVNHLLKRNYGVNIFGRLYGYASTINKLVGMVSAFAFGIILDKDGHAYSYIYPLLGIIGVFSIILLSRIDNEPFIKKERPPFFRSVRESFSRMNKIIISNKPFRDFELGFMFYGFAFMFTISVITIFLADKLLLNYSSIAFYKNFAHLFAIIFMPFFGKFMDKTDPRKFGMWTFLFLMLYILFVGAAEYIPGNFVIWDWQIFYMLLVSFFFYSLFSATMTLVWNVGSSYFCLPDEAADYQSVHLSLVGTRALFAPLVGVWMYEMLGFSAVFLISAGFLLAGILIMFISVKRHRINETA